MKFYYVFYKNAEGVESFKEFTRFNKALEFAFDSFTGSSSDGFSIQCFDESCKFYIPFYDEILDIFSFVDK